ncbi:hypothetical protein E9S_03689 [Moraxella catarrhalis BC7]|nr:hypothetical protein E9S_03689 [Moraxella catarrhalis BC7]
MTDYGQYYISQRHGFDLKNNAWLILFDCQHLC